jgi:hypothetical protein
MRTTRKYIVIFTSQAEDDPNFDPATVKDYGFWVEADDAEEAFANWEPPADFSSQWLLVGIIPESDLHLWKLKNDGIPLELRS